MVERLVASGTLMAVKIQGAARFRLGADGIAAKKRKKRSAADAATKEFEQEQTEKTEAEKLCQNCAILGNSGAK